MTVDAVIWAGGDAPDGAIGDLLPDPPAIVIAADSGLDSARRFGWRPTHVIGDMDSISGAGRSWAEANAAITRHPQDKDATDLELALELASDELACREVLVVGGAGGRLDHLLANLALLASARWAGSVIGALLGDHIVAVVRTRVSLRGTPGSTVSIIPMHGGVRGVTTTGLRWPLADADLAAGTSRGVSNELVAEEATVSLVEGVAVTIQPELGRRQAE